MEEVKILTLGSFLQLRFESIMGHIQCQHNVDYEGQRPHFLDEGIPYIMCEDKSVHIYYIYY